MAWFSSTKLTLELRKMRFSPNLHVLVKTCRMTHKISVIVARIQMQWSDQLRPKLMPRSISNLHCIKPFSSFQLFYWGEIER